MFETVLVANRGEIARRVIRTVQRMGLQAVAVHSEADAKLPYVREADEAVAIGPAPPAQSYRDVEAVLEAARQTGAEAVHPGYGFLAEDAAFARRVQKAGLVWVGPSPEAIEAMGDKIRARNLVAAAGVPVSRGTTRPVGDVEEAVRSAHDIGYPVMVKASAGGGGMGMAVADDEAALRVELERVRGFARADVRRPVGAARAVLPAGPARRGAGPRARRRPGGRAGRARLLGPAAEPEGGRGDPVTGGDPRAARAAVRRGGARCRGSRLPQRGHRRVPAGRRLRGVGVPGDEHPAAGGAPDHRDGHRHRPGRAAAARRRRAPGDLRPRRRAAPRATRSSCG